MNRRWLRPWLFVVVGAFVAILSTLLGNLWAGKVSDHADSLQTQIGKLEQKDRGIIDEGVWSDHDYNLSVVLLSMAPETSGKTRDAIMRRWADAAMNADLHGLKSVSDLNKFMTKYGVQFMEQNPTFKGSPEKARDYMKKLDMFDQLDYVAQEAHSDWGINFQNKLSRNQANEAELSKDRQVDLNQVASIRLYATLFQMLGVIIAVAKDLVFPKA